MPGYPAPQIFMFCKVQLWRVKWKEIAVRLVVTETTFSKALAVYWEVDRLIVCRTIFLLAEDIVCPLLLFE